MYQVSVFISNWTLSSFQCSLHLLTWRWRSTHSQSFPPLLSTSSWCDSCYDVHTSGVPIDCHVLFLVFPLEHFWRHAQTSFGMFTRMHPFRLSNNTMRSHGARMRPRQHMKKVGFAKSTRRGDFEVVLKLLEHRTMYLTNFQGLPV